MTNQKTDALFSLVKSMTKQEKIYFKRHMKFWGDKKQQSLQLFDLMDGMKEFDEKLLKQKLSKLPFYKRINRVRFDLNREILASLTNSFTDADEIEKLRYRLNDELKQVGILKAKRLYDQAAKILNYIKKEAAEVPLYDIQFAALELEKAMLRDGGKDKFVGQMQAVNRERHRVFEVGKNVLEYDDLRDELNLQFMTIGPESDEFSQLLHEVEKHPLLQSAESALSSRTKAVYYELKGMTLWLASKHKKAMEEFGNFKEFAEQSNWAPFDTKLNAYVNYLKACQRLFRIKEGNETIEAIKLLKPFNDNQRALSRGKTELSVLTYFNKTMQFERSLEFVQYQLVVEAFEKIPDMIKVFICHHHALLHFVLENYDKTIEWHNRQLDLKFNEMTIQTIGLTKLLTTLAHIELGNFDLAESMIRSLLRKLPNKGKDLHCWATLAARYLQKQPPSGKATIEFMKELRSQLPLAALRDSHSDEAGNFFPAWVESKIQQKSVKEILEMVREKRIAYIASQPDFERS